MPVTLAVDNRCSLDVDIFPSQELPDHCLMPVLRPPHLEVIALVRLVD